jgi:hypothetical protein
MSDLPAWVDGWCRTILGAEPVEALIAKPQKTYLDSVPLRCDAGAPAVLLTPPPPPPSDPDVILTGCRALLSLITVSVSRMTGERFMMLAVKFALVVVAVAVAVVAGTSAIWWETLEPWLAGHPELAEWAVAAGTAILAVATFVLGIQASREGSQVARQVELQRRQLAASERPVVYPITPHEWLETLGDGGRWLAFRNGGTGIALNVRGRLWSYGDKGGAELIAQTFGADDHARVWLAEERNLRHWWGAEGYVIYEDIQGSEWQSRFRYESDGAQVWAKLTNWGESADLGDPAAAFPREGWAEEENSALPGPSRSKTDFRTTPWP